MLENITKAIIEFDPLDLLPYAPSDEYDEEIHEIYSFLKNNVNCDLDTLAGEIYEVFKKTLGDDVFTKTIADCHQVASKILKN